MNLFVLVLARDDPFAFRLLIDGVTSGLNFTQNHRFEFAVAAAAGAVD
jgi:hypothetical protein